MLNFDKNIYLKDFKKITALRTEIEDLVDGVMKNPIKNVYLIGIGGTLALMQPLDCMIRKYSAVPVYTVSAAELVLDPGKPFGPGTFALMMSESGETKETVAAAEYCAKAGLNPVGVSCKRNSSLSKAIKYCIISEESDRYSSDGDFIRLYMIVARLLKFPFWTEFGYEYAVGFAFGWFLFQTWAMHNMGNSLGVSLWKAGRAEFFSMLTVMIGMGLVMYFVTPAVVGQRPDPTPAAFWGFASLGLMVGFIFTYPMNWWLVSIGWKHGMA